MSELCLGAMTFGEESGSGAPESVSREIYARYRELGGNFVDTANIYNNGTSERLTGKFIADERAQIVLATKYSMSTDHADPNAGGNSRKNMVQALEASLRRLDTDYVDLYWVHGWDQLTRVDEVMRALDDMVRAGKILHVGVSNMPAWLISQANTLAAERNMSAFTAVQMHYNLVERSIETDYFDLCDAQDMAVLSWSPLAGGLLTGKFNAGAESVPEDARLAKAAYGPAMLAEARLQIARGVTSMAADIGCTPPQLALAWVLQRPGRSVIPMLGARTPEQLEDNLGCLSVQLTDDQISELDGLSPAPVIYPASLFRTPFFRQMMHGDHPLTGND